VKPGKGSRAAANRFAANRGPTIPPVKEYVPARRVQKPPFHAEIEEASQWAQDSPEFLEFVEKVVNLPPQMAPGVSEAIRGQKWKIAPNPLAAIRTSAHQEAKRMGIDTGPGQVRQT
jgi:hypothetical protein